MVAHFSLCILVKGKKFSGKSQAQFREMLRKLKIKQNDGVGIKKDLHPIHFSAIFHTPCSSPYTLLGPHTTIPYWDLIEFFRNILYQNENVGSLTCRNGLITD